MAIFLIIIMFITSIYGMSEIKNKSDKINPVSIAIALIDIAFIAACVYLIVTVY